VDVFDLALGQSLTVSGTASLAAVGAPGQNLWLNLCYWGSTGDISGLTDQDYFGFLQLPAGIAMPFAMTRSFSIPPDPWYVVGLCGCVDGSAADGTNPWSVEQAWVSVQVFQQ
jgi:hypothetical protein